VLGKLGVTSRTQALVRAQRLGLVSSAAWVSCREAAGCGDRSTVATAQAPTRESSAMPSGPMNGPGVASPAPTRGWQDARAARETDRWAGASPTPNMPAARLVQRPPRT
jgi:hypothetical protein